MHITVLTRFARFAPFSVDPMEQRISLISVFSSILRLETRHRRKASLLAFCTLKDFLHQIISGKQWKSDLQQKTAILKKVNICICNFDRSNKQKVIISHSIQILSLTWIFIQKIMHGWAQHLIIFKLFKCFKSSNVSFEKVFMVCYHIHVVSAKMSRNIEAILCR